MTRILVVDDDNALRTTIARHLAASGYVVDVADNVGAALSLLRAARVDVLVTDLRMPERDGIDLLATLRAVSPHTRAILMSAFATARDYQTAVDLGAVTVLCKPFSRSALLTAIRQAVECESGFHGTFHGMSLIDILQMFHFARRSVSLHVLGASLGTIHMREGEIVHAERAGVLGVAAFAAILSARSGCIRTTVLAGDVPQSITRSFDSLLLDSLRELDEQSRDRSADGGDEGELAGDDRTFADRARSAWNLATQSMGGASTGVVALTLSLRSGAVVCLSGGVDAAQWSNDVRDVLDATSRIAGGGSFACHLVGAGAAGVVHSAREGFAIVLFDVLARPSSATWFRSFVSTVARTVLEHK